MSLGACRRRRRRGGMQLYQLRAAWGATGQLSGIRLGMWISASGGAAQSASLFICTLGEAVRTRHCWPLGDEGKQAELSGGLSGPPSYPCVLLLPFPFFLGYLTRTALASL